MSDAAALMDRMYRHQRRIYDVTRKYYLLGRDEAIARLAPGPGEAVLEIGCGTGRNLIRAARAAPQAQFYGLDVSREMLETAEAAIRRAGLAGRVSVAQADATAFDPAALFGRATFERVMISYALSMIPPWREALAKGLDVVAPGGALHVVDFGDCAGLPAPFKAALRRWLAAFDVTPREDLDETLAAFAAARGFSSATESWGRGYATLAVARRAA
ncbi:S-adenosylmethionine-diacylgycerolhomoserine-N-methyltransferase [Roseiarcus fermentans]|uniref:S-adenosylmethionine-diacylgycerolhomoserine-N-methyltransferase n=2 Tax=Roseiarcus fermentans TaxID=1473586 RepID=A0A366FP38_9HYPH|nr:S-adenosylmethionine-diacylgycerolhomoserine-N-methyltransferase [Roseiarcus fermentans]